MNNLIQHNRLQRAFSIFATAALLLTVGISTVLTVGISTAGAVPQDLTTEEAKRDCDYMGGSFEDYGDEGYACVYDGHTQVCRQGTCEILCAEGVKCITDQKVELPDTTPPPITPPLGGPVIVAPPITVAEAPDTTPPPKTPPRLGIPIIEVGPGGGVLLPSEQNR